MVVEHSFITKMEAREVFRVAAEFLKTRGFHVSDGPRPHEADGARCDVMGFKRGMSGAEGARSGDIADLPQSVWIEYDRGRVVVGASILAYPQYTFIQSRKEVPPNSEDAKPYLNLLFMLTLALEGLVGHQPPEKPVMPEHWGMLEASFAQHRKSIRMRELRKLGIVAVVIVCFLAFIIAVLRSAGPSPARANQQYRSYQKWQR